MGFVYCPLIFPFDKVLEQIILQKQILSPSTHPYVTRLSNRDLVHTKMWVGCGQERTIAMLNFTHINALNMVNDFPSIQVKD